MSPYIVRILAVLSGLLCHAAAVPIVVTSDADSGAGSLRAAFAAALSAAGADEIQFAAALNGRAITLAGEIGTSAQQVTVDSTGLANGITLSGNGVSRIFSVPAGGSLELRGLTLTRGHSSGSGGAVTNAGTLTLKNCTLSGHVAVTSGGAVFNAGTCSAEQCTFFGNSAAAGGAVHSAGPLTLTHCTLTGNAASNGGGLINSSAATLTNSILALNTASANAAGADIFNAATVTRSGANLVQAHFNSGGSDSGPAALNAAPRLQPLGNYGGPVPTMPPRADSPALDRVVSTSFTTDQRGLPRVLWGAADLGAVEAGTQADCAWEVREFYRTPATPLASLADALALAADPAASVRVSTPPVLNHSDPDAPGASGYFPGDEPVGVNNRTPQGLVNGDDNDFATVARTFISITVEDNYTFGFSSSEGARLRVFGATFTASTRLNAANPANPAHSGDTLSFPGLTDNSATLGVCHLTPGVYAVEFLTWERSGGASYEVLAARGAHTAVDAALRLAGDLSPGGPFTTGTLTAQALPEEFVQEFDDGEGGFTVTNVNGPFDGPWTLDEANGTWGTAGQGADVAAAPSTQLTAPAITMHCFGDATLRFTHRFSFERSNGSNKDGGQVLLSVNGGAPTLVPGTAFTQGGYTGTVAINSTADIRSQAAFVFDSPGYVVPVYINSVVRLGTFNAGDILRVQFLAAFDKDGSRGNPAWEIDHVTIEQQCAGASPGWELTTIRDGADSMDTALTQVFAHWAGTPQPGVIKSFAATLNLHDPQSGGGGHSQTQTPFPGDSAADDDQFALGARAVLNVPATEDYTFCLLADDAARFRIKGSRWWTVSSVAPALTLVDGFQTGGAADVFGQVRLAAGVHEIELVYHEGFGGAHVSLWGARGRHTAFDAEVFTLVGGPGMIRAAAPFSLSRQSGIARPANDDFAAAAEGTALSVVCTQGASRETSEPGTTDATVWWQWAAPAGTWVLNTAGSDFDTVLTVFSGSSLAALTSVATNDNYGTAPAARLSLTVAAPATFYIQAGGVSGSTGRLALQISRAFVPEHDAFASALALGARHSLSATGDNDAATAEPGEPPHAPGSPARHSVWFTWTAPAAGEYSLDTRGSQFDTLLAVYAGSTLTGLTPVAANDDISAVEKQSLVTFSTLAGTTYRIAVDGRTAAARGGLRLNITHRAVVTAHTLLRGPLPNSPRTFRMTWRSEPWTTYRIERSADLGTWSTVTANFSSAGATSGLDIGNLSAGTPRQYFRVRRE